MHLPRSPRGEGARSRAVPAAPLQTACAPPPGESRPREAPSTPPAGAEGGRPSPPAQPRGHRPSLRQRPAAGPAAEPSPPGGGRIPGPFRPRLPPGSLPLGSHVAPPGREAPGGREGGRPAAGRGRCPHRAAGRRRRAGHRARRAGPGRAGLPPPASLPCYPLPTAVATATACPREALSCGHGARCCGDGACYPLRPAARERLLGGSPWTAPLAAPEPHRTLAQPKWRWRRTAAEGRGARPEVGHLPPLLQPCLLRGSDRPGGAAAPRPGRCATGGLGLAPSSFPLPRPAGGGSGQHPSVDFSTSTWRTCVC